MKEKTRIKKDEANLKKIPFWNITFRIKKYR